MPSAASFSSAMICLACLAPGIAAEVGCNGGSGVTVDAGRPLDAMGRLPDSADSARGDARARDASERDAGAEGGLLPGRPEVICARDSGRAVAPEASTFILDATVQRGASLEVQSNGDLWPSCWSGHALYAAWGDGFGFSDAGAPGEAGAEKPPTIGVAKILGDPVDGGRMSGITLAEDDRSQAIFKIWTNANYYQKPTGMLCSPGKMFLAVQDLEWHTYGDAPAATIAVSTDSGLTWVEDRSKPMFDDHEFTTIMFLDYGPDAAWSKDGYVYVYGLDYNWKSSETITQPQGLYLARVASADTLRDRSTWEFFGGIDAKGEPVWTAAFADRLPVLVDCTLRYPTATYEGYSVLSQGSVVYDAPRSRYLYTSWTKYTFEFYEAPSPWGPWRKFLYEDFGPYPWTAARNGGYATTAPSKFIDEGGTSMWIQSNSYKSGVTHDNFSLRTLEISE